MIPAHTAAEWYKKSKDENSPKIVFSINTIKQEVFDEIQNYNETINAVGDLLSIFYEKFLFENQKTAGFDKYFKIPTKDDGSNDRLRITDDFYDQLMAERRVIGEKIDPANYNHIDQLNNQKLHKELFNFCENSGIDITTFLRFCKCKWSRNSEIHLNLNLNLTFNLFK